MDIWLVIADERLGLVDTFEQLQHEQWNTPSLCGHWTVRQVLGHLVIATDPALRGFLIAMVKARGSFDRANDRLALQQAERPTADLIADLRSQVAQQYTPPGLGPEAPLNDILLHSLDVRIPLELPTERPAERYEPALELMFGKGVRMLVPKGRPTLRWVATDHAWEHGTGDEVQGTMADLTLAASGRAARIDALTGPGQSAVAAWLRR